MNQDQPPEPSPGTAKIPGANSGSGSGSGSGAGAGMGMSMAMRMSTELVSGVFVGGGIGYLLDYWLNTKPWMTVIFFLLGTVAGFRNLYRCTQPIEERPKP